MQPKPLTKERRVEIESLLHWFGAEGEFTAQEIIQDLLDSEAFWREAVKNAHKCPFEPCGFCGEDSVAKEHKPDCAWKLAKDGE